MDYQVPEGWKFYGSANNGNQTTFTLPGHSVVAPYLAIFDRRVPQSNGGSLSTPSYRVRVIHGSVDSEGIPLAARCVIDTNIRWPFGFASADVKAAIAVLGVLFSSDTLRSDIVDEQLLPTTVASA